MSVMSVVLGGNPLVPHVGMADPNLHRFNGSFFVFGTHDFSVDNTGEFSSSSQGPHHRATNWYGNMSTMRVCLWMGVGQ